MRRGSKPAKNCSNPCCLAKRGGPWSFSLPRLHCRPRRSPRRIGLSRVALVADYPIVTATYGFSRAEYSPNECRLNPFPPDPSHGRPIPLFVDQVQADALLLGLNGERVSEWLIRNGFAPTLPNGSNQADALRAYFVQLFDDLSLRQTLGVD